MTNSTGPAKNLRGKSDENGSDGIKLIFFDKTYLFGYLNRHLYSSHPWNTPLPCPRNIPEVYPVTAFSSNSEISSPKVLLVF